jgi:hypothetical protein
MVIFYFFLKICLLLNFFQKKKNPLGKIVSYCFSNNNSKSFFASKILRETKFWGGRSWGRWEGGRTPCQRHVCWGAWYFVQWGACGLMSCKIYNLKYACKLYNVWCSLELDWAMFGVLQWNLEYIWFVLFPKAHNVQYILSGRNLLVCKIFSINPIFKTFSWSSCWVKTRVVQGGSIIHGHETNLCFFSLGNRKVKLLCKSWV